MRNDKHTQPRLTLCRGDILAAALIFLAAVALLVYFGTGARGNAATVQVWQDGTLQGEYPLAVDREFVVAGRYHNTVQIQNGRVCILDADCPGQDCVKSGWHKDTGRGTVCLPNRLELRLAGGAAEPEIDGVTG